MCGSSDKHDSAKFMAMNEGRGKLRELGIKYVYTVLFIKAN